MFGSLFSGIGGLDLGLERAGMEVRWQVESDPFCNRVLEKFWPDVRRYGDITTVDAGRLERVDLICGGFPCQPWSVAGRGDGESDDRNLWPDTIRVIRGVGPRLVLLENVPGLLAHGYFGTILGDLAESGYDAEWDCIPAAAVGAPHLRYRLFIIAYASGSRFRGIFQQDGQPERLVTAKSGRNGEAQSMANPKSHLRRTSGDEGRIASNRPGPEVADAQRRSGDSRTERSGRQTRADSSGSVQGTTLADAEGSRWSLGRREGRDEAPHTGLELSGASVVGLDWWAVEPDVGRVAHGIPARVDHLRGLGNAVVPQVAEWIGRRIVSVD